MGAGANTEKERGGWLDKLNVALICNGYGMVNRGAERYTEELYNHFNDIFNIDIYGIKKTDHSFGTNTKFRDNIRIPWRNGRAYAESYYFGKKWYKTCKEKYDVVLNNAGIGGSYWCRKYRKKTGTPFITFERGGGREEIINCLFKPDCMSFLTKTSQKKMNKKCLPKVKTTVLPIGIDLSDYKKKRQPSKLLNGLERPIFLSTSAIVNFKRIDLTIKAIAKLEKGSLVQTSKGNMKDNIVSLGKELLGKRFKYVGIVNREELLKLYQSCDIFINASRSEAFGVVYLEAMASGLPVVTQHDGRRREVVGNGGIHVTDCENIADFSSSLFYASKEDWGDKPLQQAEKFSWDTLIPKYEKEITGVVG